MVGGEVSCLPSASHFFLPIILLSFSPSFSTLYLTTHSKSTATLHDTLSHFVTCLQSKHTSVHTTNTHIYIQHTQDITSSNMNYYYPTIICLALVSSLLVTYTYANPLQLTKEGTVLYNYNFC